jgi:MoaA/NifB/PqqE/SkfB family radical SAM enzyme
MSVGKKIGEYRVDDIPVSLDMIDGEGNYIFYIVSYKYRRLDLE